MPFHQHNKNSLIWGWSVVLEWVYTVRLVKGYTGASHPLTLSLFFFVSLLSNPHMLCVDTSNKSSTKIVWEQNPSIMFFNPCPQNKKTTRNTGTIKHTHLMRKKKIHNKRGECSSFLGQGYVPVK